MRMRIYTWIFFVTIIAAFLASACKKEKETMNTLDGLKSSISSVSWVDTSKIEIEYRLERVGSTDSWVINPGEPLNIYYWNTGSQRVDKDEIFETAAIDPGFISGQSDVFTTRVTARVPKNSASVSIAFGRSGLETKRMDLPAPSP